MRVLAVESSSVVAGIAILDDSSLVYEGYNHHKKNHSQALMPMIENALITSELKLSDIDIIAVTKGPVFHRLKDRHINGKGSGTGYREKGGSYPYSRLPCT